jgi:hypothetical protein
MSAVLAGTNRPQWQQDALAVARAVAEGCGERYIATQRVEGSEAYGDMEDFIDTVSDRRLQDQFVSSISGRGAFRYFGDVLFDYPREQKRWFAFRDAQMRQRVLDWLESHGIDPIEE